jgi:putative phosphoribosyl transferase
LFDSIKKKFQFKFKDRANAANILAAALEDFLEKEEGRERGRKRERKRKNTLIVVLGIPRGGVIVADIVAKKLKASDFDIVLPRKLRIPHNEEAAFGAIMEDGTIYLDDRLVKDLEISVEYIEKEKNLQLQEIERRKSLYKNTSKQQERQLENKINDNTIVILTDDGAASGATVITAARSIRKKNSFNNAKELIIALPVAPKETVELLRKEAAVDHVEVITAPSSFFNSVGQFYQNFQPVSDEQVIEIMKKWNLL